MAYFLGNVGYGAFVNKLGQHHYREVQSVSYITKMTQLGMLQAVSSLSVSYLIISL